MNKVRCNVDGRENLKIFDNTCCRRWGGAGVLRVGVRRVVKTNLAYCDSQEVMAREKNYALRQFCAALRKAGVKLQTAYMQTKPPRSDGRPHGVMPSKRRGNGWTKKRKSKK